MHNIVSNFDQIIDFAKVKNVPVDRKKSILKEYIQSKFVSTLYSLPNSHMLSLTRDSSLRLIHNIGRFSQDLSFINLGATDDVVAKLFFRVIAKFKYEGFDVSLDIPNREWRSIEDSKSEKALQLKNTYFDIQVNNILDDLNLSSVENEVLNIRISYENPWLGLKIENILFNSYGFIESVLSLNLHQLFSIKLFNFVKDNSFQSKEMYDIVWLYSKGAKIDKAFLKLNLLDNLIYQAQERYLQGGLPESYKNRLVPLLFDFNDVKKIELFDMVLDDLIKY